MPERGPETTALEGAFLRDHRRLTRQLSRTLAALKCGDLAQAVKIADELDHAAGAHIRFEEEVLYPQVAKVHGQKYVDVLLEEHRRGQAAVARLLRHRESFPPDQLPELIDDFNVAVNHASSCGTLLSHLSSATDDKQSGMLSRLGDFEEVPTRWSNLPGRTT